MQPSIPVRPVPFQPLPAQPDSGHLNALIARLKDQGESELLIEHLQTASAYLYGAMPEECTHNLEMAQQMSGGVHTKSLQGEVKETISGLLHELHPPASAHWRHRAMGPTTSVPTADGLRDFFHGADSRLGIFYPTKHIVAVFRSFHQAEEARDRLRAYGLHPGEAIAAPGFEVADFFAYARQHHSLWSQLAMQVSRFLDTEAGLVDRYGKWARRGAGFLAVYSPTDEQAEELAQLVRPLEPIAMHCFMPGYIRHLT